jgi:hypothetical protein
MFEKFVEDYQKNASKPDPFAYLSWIEADQNPFSVRMLDCRSVTQTMMATTNKQEIAESFGQLRRSTGEQHKGKRLENAIQVRCLLYYPHGESRDGPLFIAESMEFKAAIGFISSGGALISAIETNPENLATKEMSDIESFVARQVDYLVWSHLYKTVVPHPIPSDFPNNPKKIALYSFSQYGKHAFFATYEDVRLANS